MKEQRLSGVGVSPVSAVGTAVWYTPEPELADPPAPETVDTDTELDRFLTAKQTAKSELQDERERTAAAVGESEAEVFDAHIQFLEDPQIESGVESAVNSGCPAEHAASGTFAKFIEQFEEMSGQMAERADDLRDVRDRLIRILTNGERADLSSVPPDSVILAERLTPSDTAQLDPDRVAGFATVTGGRTSHAAIFARSLALPAVVGVGAELNTIEAESSVVVDGIAGTVINDPTTETQANVGGESVTIQADSVSTIDGRSIEVAANVGTSNDVQTATEYGADGVGLFRSEFLFLDRAEPPTEAEQYETYRSAIESFPDGRVVVRTLDVGGDKQIEYLDLPAEDNPFLGERGIRRSLGPDEDLFNTQLRALLRAARDADSGDLAVMLPLVSTVEEVTKAQSMIETVANAVETDSVDDNTGGRVETPEFGVMIETPASAFLAPELTEHIDFFSIGTNDLAQYVMAAERGNDRVKALGDYQQPAVIRAIDATVRAAEGTDTWVGMCGEMAGDPSMTELLIGIGLTELSMSAVSIPRVKTAVQTTSVSEAQALVENVREATTQDMITSLLNTE
ncbi:phosphoenolpyruvate--protein phosphotransferase [Haloquadratum walsbyi]|jgi:phosphoenolpyruvate--protein phosphotransferase (EC 2.7.3.9)|uniref:Phosphoenolpyruvate-protein phosphotransferase n=1 Tax=Haloquadratum walsbyi J07HQW2 TaxID=1238425 RepID=U1NDV3_9EURY|nr:phosphoenolpyruvate--protein phosphotransferase [Haloquadratum walsbyi]ERG94913.1 MAG: phosphoenolpyruvate-protein phosphotransferase [Haloquadratum walsbyi J07HQW2]